MRDDLVAVACRSSGVPCMYPTPPTICMSNREGCRVQATSSPPLLTPCVLNKDLGVFRAGSTSVGPVLFLPWDLENLSVVWSSPVETRHLPQHQQELAGTSLQLRLQQLPRQGKVCVLFPVLHQQPWLLGTRRSHMCLERAQIPGSS